ncbi:flippase [Sphingobacterium thalpophilum]|uniref:flippase n=1 Tax=Sphingobacterium thalpophilum TaxID=259 RepID=UPI0024A68CEE|nr:flippase [Sphingobacterium thalpophilum]
MSVKRNFVYNIILTSGNIIFPVITFPFLSRVLGPEGVGEVQFINTFAQYFVMIAALGIPIYGIREVAKARSDDAILKKTITELLVIHVITSVFFSIIYFLLICNVDYFSINSKFYIIFSLILLTGFGNLEWLFSGLERFRFIAVRSLLVKVISFALILLFIRTKNDLGLYVWILAGGFLLNNSWNIFHAWKYVNFSLLRQNDFKKHFNPLLYIFSSIAAISGYVMLDTIILGFIKGYEAVGYYTAASRLTKPVVPVLTALGGVLIPKISEAFHNKDLKTVKSLSDFSFDFVVLMGVPMCLGFILLANELIILLCGEEFLFSSLSLKIFAVVVFIIGISNIWAIQILTPAGKDKLVTYSVIGGLVVSCVLNFVLIPIYSYNGAAVTNFLTELFVTTCFLFFVKRNFGFGFDFKLVLKAVASCLLFFPIYKSVTYFCDNLWGICILTALCCGGAYFLIQLFLFHNVILVKQFEKLRSGLKNGT